MVRGWLARRAAARRRRREAAATEAKARQAAEEERRQARHSETILSLQIQLEELRQELARVKDTAARSAETAQVAADTVARAAARVTAALHDDSHDYSDGTDDDGDDDDDAGHGGSAGGKLPVQPPTLPFTSAAPVGYGTPGVGMPAFGVQGSYAALHAKPRGAHAAPEPSQRPAPRSRHTVQGDDDGVGGSETGSGQSQARDDGGDVGGGGDGAGAGASGGDEGGSLSGTDGGVALEGAALKEMYENQQRAVRMALDAQQRERARGGGGSLLTAYFEQPTAADRASSSPPVPGSAGVSHRSTVDEDVAIAHSEAELSRGVARDTDGLHVNVVPGARANRHHLLTAYLESPQAVNTSADSGLDVSAASSAASVGGAQSPTREAGSAAPVTGEFAQQYSDATRWQ